MNKTIDAGRLASWISDLQFTDYEDKETYEIYQNIIEGLKDFPSVGSLQKWISVKEDLPKKPGEYICTCRWDESESFEVAVLEYGSPVNNRWAGSDRVFSNGYAFGENWGADGESEMDNIEEVIAWMPLPDPFEPMEDF